MHLPPLYPITDRALAGGKSHVEIVRLLAVGGASLVQVREKALPDRALADEVLGCVAVPGVAIVVNDRPDIAKVAGAAGVHLGEEDLPSSAARSFLGAGALIGVSTHSIADAIAACARPVDYVALGPIFETSTARTRRAALGVAAVEAAVRAMTKPLVAIGGINLERAPAILDAGAASVAVIADVMTAASIPDRVREYLSLRRGR